MVEHHLAKVRVAGSNPVSRLFLFGNSLIESRFSDHPDSAPFLYFACSLIKYLPYNDQKCDILNHSAAGNIAIIPP